MNLPNLITCMRFVLSIFVFVLIDIGDESWHFDVALGLLIAAGISDFLDGYLARKYKLETAFGRIADPFADKFLVGINQIIEKLGLSLLFQILHYGPNFFFRHEGSL